MGDDDGRCHGTLIHHPGQYWQCTDPDCAHPELAVHALSIDCEAVGCECCEPVQSRRRAV